MSLSCPSPASARSHADSPWRDPARDPDERVELLLAEMTIEEKLAQLGSVWKDANITGINVAPRQDVFTRDVPPEQARTHGIGQLTRPFGSYPQEPSAAARKLAEEQRDLLEHTRLGIPAIVHEECLTGFTTWKATVYPTPLAWAATFDEEIVRTMGAAIGSDMRDAGVHQGLAPVLDVVRDHRWGRVEETLGEDPYLSGVLGSAYVAGLQSAGVLATLKHFVGYSASQAARNHAPVHAGWRELRDVLLIPFEMAVRAGVASVMNSYSELDGEPVAASHALLTEVLRDEWGFTGTVVSDYWSIAFLESMHAVAADPGTAGAVALEAGLDVELPDTRSYGAPLATLVRSGVVDEALVDRSVRRVLRQKLDLGLLDADWSPEPPRDPDALCLDSPRNRSIARRVAEESVVLLENSAGVLPIEGVSRLAVVGPCADDVNTAFGCYSYPNHVLPGFPDLDNGIEAVSLRAALAAETGQEPAYAEGCPVLGGSDEDIAAAVAVAAAADVCIVAVGDRSGLFGHGTSGEGCDVPDLQLPGRQAELVDAVLSTGTPVVLVVASGRPYALGRFVGRTAAIVQAFLPGEEGGPALAGVLTGRVVPSGKLPVQIPRLPGVNPATYLHPALGGASDAISNLDPSPAFPFGHGLSYTAFRYEEGEVSADEIATDGRLTVRCVVRNVGDRRAAEVVQLYFNDPVAQVTRPVVQLLGFARVDLGPGEAIEVRFAVPADRLAFTGRDMTRIVEPGAIRLLLGSSSEDIRHRFTVELTGPTRVVGADRELFTAVETRPVAG